MKIFLAYSFIFAAIFNLPLQASKFYVANIGIPNIIKKNINSKTHYNIQNFRFRLIAEDLRDKNSQEIAQYLSINQHAIDKALLPSLHALSPQVPLYQFASPARRLTLIVSADIYRKEKFYTKAVLFAQHLNLDKDLHENDTLALDLQRAYFNTSNNLQLEFLAFHYRDGESGCQPINIIDQGYVSLYNQ